LAVIVAGVVISLAMILYFLWRVYDRGGPKHVQDVARALHEVYDANWPAKLLCYTTTKASTAWSSPRGMARVRLRAEPGLGRRRMP
jgi:hypothetical protein